MASNSGETSKKRRGSYLQFLSDPSKKTPKSTFYNWNKQAEQNESRTFARKVQFHGDCEMAQDNRALMFEASTSSSSLGESTALHPEWESPDDEADETDHRTVEIPRDFITNTDDEEADRPAAEESETDDDFLVDDMHDLDSEDESGSWNAQDHEARNVIAEEEQQPVYQGAPITLGASLLLIMAYAVRHALSGVALADLLILIELHCVAPNLCRTSMKLLRAFFKKVRCPIELHYYCTTCHHYIGPEKGTSCPNPLCLRDLTIPRNSSYFVTIPLATQICSLLIRKYQC